MSLNIQHPSHWLKLYLPEVALLNMGQSPSGSDVNTKCDGIPFLQGKAEFGKLYPTPIKYCSNPKKIADSGDILLSIRAPVGPTNIANQKTSIGRGLTAIKSRHNVTFDKFLLYYFRNIEPWMSQQGTGTTFKAISSQFLKELPFWLPPLFEQKVIADLLDQLIGQVDKLKLRLETILTALKQFRQSVLNAAVTGKLTEDWREKNRTTISVHEFKKNIKQYRLEKWIDEQNTKFRNKSKWPKNDDWKKKYIEPVLSNNYKHNTLPSGWIVEPLEGLIYISARIGWKGLKASEYTQKGPLFLSVHSLNYGMYVKLSEAFHISQERYDESPEIILENNDILLCKDGAGIGKVGIIKNLKEQATINSSLLLIRAGNFFIPEYLYFFFSGPIMQGLVHERMTGSAVPHLFQRDVKEFILEVPPIEEQQEIVNRVENYFSFADKIEQQVKSAQERVNNLTPALLAKAFKGELTADWRAKHPELISGENSAEALLKRIQAEQAALTKPAKAKKVKK